MNIRVQKVRHILTFFLFYLYLFKFIFLDTYGWSDWSNWSYCTENSIQVRTRKCLIEHPKGYQCKGDKFESRPCDIVQCNSVYTASVMWTSLLSVFMASSVVSILVTFYFMRKQFKKQQEQQQSALKSATPFSYTNTNTYTSLPTKDVSLLYLLLTILLTIFFLILAI